MAYKSIAAVSHRIAFDKARTIDMFVEEFDGNLRLKKCATFCARQACFTSLLIGLKQPVYRR